jgi:3-methylfumaryl-CoA hydratase
VRHEVSSNGKAAIIEERDIVYRDLAKPGELGPSAAGRTSSEWRRVIRPDPALFFFAIPR